MKRIMVLFGAGMLLVSFVVAERPEDPPCQASCAWKLAAAMKECKGDAECRADARAAFETCSEACSAGEE